jgi:HSP20 family protein
MARELVALNPLHDLQEEVNSLFRTFFADGGRTELSAATRAVWAPTVDIEETEDAYEITADIPGLTAKDVRVKLQDRILTIHGERKYEKSDRKRGVHRSERTWGAFTRSFLLPDAAEGEKAQANMKEGVLTVRIPKREEAKPKELDIKAG